MPIEEKVLILQEALNQVCKVLREHQTEMDWYLEDMDRIARLTGGSQRDPEGKEWAEYFIVKAYEKLLEKGVLSNE